jgi:hypothetical protein
MPAGKVGAFSKPAFLYPMGAIGVLAVVFFVYYFAVTARQEASLNRRSLRALAAVADGFHNRVLNLATVVGQAGKNKNEPNTVSFETYLKEQSPDLVAGNPKETRRCEPRETTIEAKLTRQEWDIEFKCGTARGYTGAGSLDVGHSRKFRSPQRSTEVSRLRDEFERAPSCGTTWKPSSPEGCAGGPGVSKSGFIFCRSAQVVVQCPSASAHQVLEASGSRAGPLPLHSLRIPGG